uniref:Galactose-binding lectin n=1 Tax=Sclerophytum lochmodes TaxID=3286417 RepID=A4CYJ7_9CNID|nr:galactose-binding lectin [Sinularia lochmodes]
MKLIWGIVIAVFVANCAVNQGARITFLEMPKTLGKTVGDSERLAKRRLTAVSRCVMGSSTHYCWPSQCDTSSDEAISFQLPFENTPNVIVSFGMLDVDSTRNLRVNSSADDVDEEGFTLHFNTWANTIVWNYKLIWIACD